MTAMREVVVVRLRHSSYYQKRVLADAYFIGRVTPGTHFKW